MTTIRTTDVAIEGYNEAQNKAVAEIIVKMNDILAFIERAKTVGSDEEEETTPQYLASEIFWFVRRFEGSYQYNGLNGWKYALEHNDKPFDKNDW
jgi:hypothetical protein